MSMATDSGMQVAGPREGLPAPGLRVSVGQYSDRGQKRCNQDFAGYRLPPEPRLSLKGLAFAMADGVSSSDVSQIASETAVTSFLDDYFCTSEAWSVRSAAEKVLAATNAWLYGQNRRGPYRYERHKGYVCTLSALVLKAATAHLVHVGDTRIYRLREAGLEQLTHDHRLWMDHGRSCLSRALGAEALVEIDYQALPLKVGDTFILATDGVYEHIPTGELVACIQSQQADLDNAARCLVREALARGSDDNLSIQIIRVDALPKHPALPLQQEIDRLPLPPLLESGQSLDGYTVVRALHASSRSHVYLAVDDVSGCRLVLKLPSTDLRDEDGYLERLLMEEWIARRVNGGHVVKAAPRSRERNYLYTVAEYVEGQTLAQWLKDHPKPELETVRNLLEQVVKGLYSLHRMEILHQDIRPENLMIDTRGTVKILDFGSARVAGIAEASAMTSRSDRPGTALYMAPEYFLGEVGTIRSDLYSVGVLAYHLLSGRFPYGNQVARTRTAADQRRLVYRSVLDDERAIPVWVDETLRRAVHPNPDRRYQELSEFIHDLRSPNSAYLNKTRSPLIERHPVRFWQGVAAVLAIVVVLLLNQ